VFGRVVELQALQEAMRLCLVQGAHAIDDVDGSPSPPAA
jgi:hypothetical protein